MSNIKFKLFLKLMEVLDNAHCAMSDYQTIPKIYDNLILYKTETHTIRTIGENPGITISEIALIQQQSRSAASQIVKTLFSKQLVEQKNSEINKKEKHIYLTKTGKDIYLEHEKEDFDSYKRIYDNMIKLSNDEIVKMIEFLNYFTSSVKTDSIKNQNLINTFLTDNAKKK